MPTIQMKNQEAKNKYGLLLFIKDNNKSVIDIQNEIGVMFWYGGTSKKGLYRNDFTAGVMHFQFVNWDNLLAKQAWYRCLEKIRNPNIDTEKINNTYGESKKEAGLRRLKAPKVWFEGYKDFFNKDIYLNIKSWQKDQVLGWFDEYGINYFKELDIWDIDWESNCA